MPRPRQKAIWSVIWKPLIVGSLVVAGVAAAGGYYWQWRQPARELWLPGTVESQEVRLASRVGGRVEKVLVEEGTIVEAGEPILKLEMPELDAQRSQLEAQLAAAKAALAEAIEGPRPEEKAAAKANVAAAQARLDRMRKGFRT